MFWKDYPPIMSHRIRAPPLSEAHMKINLRSCFSISREGIPLVKCYISVGPIVYIGGGKKGNVESDNISLFGVEGVEGLKVVQ